MGKRSIPKGWIGCPKNANDLILSKFMAIKTPLRHFYNQPFSEIFPPEIIFSKAKRNQVKIGLWIDLTNTDRYYDRKVVQNQDCIYKKINCLGHGKVPSQEDMTKFISIVHNFIVNSPHEIIVVHCTHGFNRTGFMIISFLVEKLKYTVEEAFVAFAKARPPGIYRTSYIVELFRRYSKGLPPATPSLPSWCHKN